MTLKLLQDWNISDRVTLRSSSSDKTSRNITIDLNGYNITYTGSNNNGFEIINSGTILTITDNSDGDPGTVSSTSKPVLTSNSGGTIKIEGGSYSGSALMSGTGALEISDGNFTISSFINGTNTCSVSITGGTFNIDPTSYVAAGYTAVQDSTTWTVSKSETNVASVKIGTGDATGYTTFAAAVEAVNMIASTSTDDVTITLLGDASVNERAELTRTSGKVILDLAGKTLTNNGGNGIIETAANVNLTIKDSPTDGTGTVTYSSGTYKYIVVAEEDSTITIEGGTFTGFTSLTPTKKSGTINVTGGTFTGLETIASSYSGTLSITGGTFNVDPFYVASGYKATKNSDGTAWTVAARTKSEPIATVDNTEYTSIDDALKAVLDKKDSAVTLQLRDDWNIPTRVALRDGENDNGRKITIDLNGYNITYNGNSSGFEIINSGTELTITDSSDGTPGSVTSTQKAIFYSNEGGKIFVNSGTFTGEIMSGSGTLSITGGTFSQNPAQYLEDKNKELDDKTYVIKYTDETTSSSETWKVLTKANNTPKAEVTWNPEESEDFTTKYTALYTSFTGAKTAILGSGTTPVVMKLLDDWPITARQAFRIGTGTTDKTAFNITLDLYGHRIYLEETVTEDTKGFEIINANTTLTITDTTEAADGAINMGSYTLFGANSGGTIIVEKGNFTGGTFLSGSGTLSITGGTFSQDPSAGTKSYVAENYMVQENKGDTTTYTVMPIVATVTAGENTTNCATLSAALEAANDSTATAVTITLLKDAALDSQFTFNAPTSGTKTITLAMNGKTLTYSTDTPAFVVSTDTTFKITGTGTFNFDPAQYVADGYVIAYTAAGTSTAAKWEDLSETGNTPVAEVTWNNDANTAKYTSFLGALQAVDNITGNSTIKILEAISLSERFEFSNVDSSNARTITLNMNDKTFTYSKKTTGAFLVRANTT